MQLVCKCLNFILEAEDRYQSLNNEMNHRLSSRAPPFEELVLIKCLSITRRIDILVEEVEHGDWMEYSCRNCSVWMYSCPAIGNELSINCIAHESRMIYPADFDAMLMNSNYSPIFKILIFDKTDSDMNSDPKQPLHPVASEWLEDQIVLAEIRIQSYTEKEQEDIEKKRLQAHSEQVALERRAVSLDLRQEKTREGPTQLLVTKPTNVTTVLGLAAKEDNPSNIDLDLDMDESIMFESDDSDLLSEGSDDESIDQQSRRVSEPMVARSLPIPMPLFRRYADRHEKSPQTPIDIAANMRALAQSAHGDPIFGELPRPPITKN